LYDHPHGKSFAIGHSAGQQRFWAFFQGSLAIELPEWRLPRRTHDPEMFIMLTCTPAKKSNLKYRTPDETTDGEGPRFAA
jgi:hypothetical protein